MTNSSGKRKTFPKERSCAVISLHKTPSIFHSSEIWRSKIPPIQKIEHVCGLWTGDAAALQRSPKCVEHNEDDDDDHRLADNTRSPNIPPSLAAYLAMARRLHIAQLFSEACPSPAPPIHVAKAVYEVWAPSKAHTCSDGRTDRLTGQVQIESGK